jgi:DNA-binding IclR family transcriptional regulator
MNDSVRKAIQLLEELARFKKPVALRELAHCTHLNKATAFRLLNSLREKGFVQKIGEQRLYALGPTLLALAEDYRRNLTMRDRVMPYLEKLVDTCEETALYCERFQYDSCVTIERRESPHQTRTVMETGVVRNLYTGASAMAILAMLPEAEIVRILGGKVFEKYTSFTPRSPKVIWKKIEETRRRGYAVSIQERYLYTSGVAAPCFLNQNVMGSIAIIGPAERIKAMGIEKIGKTVKRIADQLSTELGHSTGLQYERPSGKRLRLVK